MRYIEHLFLIYTFLLFQPAQMSVYKHKPATAHIHVHVLLTNSYHLHVEIVGYTQDSLGLVNIMWVHFWMYTRHRSRTFAYSDKEDQYLKDFGH